MATYFLTSAFDNGFTKEFTDELLKRYKKGCLVFVASDFEGHHKTDEYLKVFVEMFQTIGIDFEDEIVVDSRLSKEESHAAIKNAAIVWLAGGNTLLQMKYLNDYELRTCLHLNPNIVIGMSAGAINMADDIVLARDVNDSVLTLSKYKGLGLTSLNIEPHLNLSDLTHQEDIKEASYQGAIYGLFDDSFVLIENEITFYGQYRIFKEGRIVQ